MYIWPMCPFCSFQLYWKQRSAAGKLQYFCFLFSRDYKPVLLSAVQLHTHLQQVQQAFRVEWPFVSAMHQRRYPTRTGLGCTSVLLLSCSPGPPPTAPHLIYLRVCMCSYMHKGKGPWRFLPARWSCRAAGGQCCPAQRRSRPGSGHGRGSLSTAVPPRSEPANGAGLSWAGCAATALLLPDQDFDNLAARRFAREEIVPLV